MKKANNMDKKDLRNIFAKNLNILLGAKGMTRKQLADALDISYSRVCDWSRARTYPTEDEIVTLSGFFYMEVDDITQEIGINNTANIKNDFFNNDDKKEELRIYDSEHFAICSSEIVSSRYYNDPKGIHFMFYVSDDLMKPKYSYNDLVLVEAINDIKKIEDGDYFIISNNKQKSWFMHIYKRDDDEFIFAPINIANSKNILPRTLTKEQIKQEYKLYKAIAITKKIQ